MNINIDFLGLDLDGTLLDSNKNITMFTKDKILKFKQMGIGVIIASGRHCNEILKYAEELNFKEGDYIICCDGQYITDYKGTILWENSYLTWNDVKIVLQNSGCNQCWFYTEIRNYQVEQRFFYRIYKKINNSFFNNKNTTILALQDQRNIEIKNIQKIVLNIKSEVLKQSFLDTYTIHLFQEGKMEILHKNVSKMNGIKYLTDVLKIHTDKILYFGDDENDKECFELMRNCIAMGNASEILKRNSIFITEDNEHDGVGIALEKIANGEIII